MLKDVKGASTAIVRNKPPKPLAWLMRHRVDDFNVVDLLTGNLGSSLQVLDYGCGRRSWMGMVGWDPGWPEASGISDPHDRKWQTIYCGYVLNVLSGIEQVRVLLKLHDMLHYLGVAYIAVRRDLPHEGRCGRGVWQCNVKLGHEMMNAFRITSIRQVAGYEIYEMRKS